MEKQRKFLLVLPLLVIPFLTMAFWALGGGKTSANKQPVAKGIDTTLPEAQFAKAPKQDKMAVYQTTSRDSSQSGVSPSFLRSMGLKRDSAKINQVTAPSNADQNAAQIQAKLVQLNRQISQPEVAAPAYNADEPNAQSIKKLQQMQKMLKNTQQQEDPQMKQLSQMLTQIQAIQNPGSLAKPKKPEDSTPFKAIPAIIDGKQKVVDGGAVRLKLTDSVQLKDQWIPKGQQIYGVCSVTNHPEHPAG